MDEAVHYGVDQAGRRIVERHPDGRVVRYRWNRLGRLTAITTVEADGRFRHRSIEYDSAGRPTIIDSSPVVRRDLRRPSRICSHRGGHIVSISTINRQMGDP